MDDVLQFGSRDYVLSLLVLFVGRAMDFISTRVATPHLVLEGNPVAKKLGWFGGVLINLAVCPLLAFLMPVSIGVSTMSILVAARNFQSAWLMRSMGEERYRDWRIERMEETPPGLYIGCLAGNTLLTAAVGGALILFSDKALIPTSIGMGIVAYAIAVALFTSLALYRNRRAGRLKLKRNIPSSVAGDGTDLVK